MTAAPLTFHKHAVGVAAFVRRAGEDPARVPCDGCTTCCRDPHIEVNLGPEEDRAGLRTHFNAAIGEWALDKRPDGSCVYLEDGGCGIHARRPAPCRMFDCRTYLVSGVIKVTPDGAESAFHRAAAERFEVVNKEPGDGELRLLINQFARELSAYTDEAADMAEGALGLAAVWLKKPARLPQAMAAVLHRLTSAEVPR